MTVLRTKFLGGLFVLIMLIGMAFSESLPNTDYRPDQVGMTVGTVTARYGFSQVAMSHGRLIGVTAPDGGYKNGMLVSIDLTNPSEPETWWSTDSGPAFELRESHGWGFRGDTIVVQAYTGVQFWKLGPGRKFTFISALEFPDAHNRDYNNAIWWTHWQGRYLYAGGTDNGLYIADALDPLHPVFLKKVPINELGGFRVGATHAIGNMLVLTGFDDGPSGVSVLDISDPVNPKLLSTVREVSSYASMVNGYRLVLGARNRPENAAVVYDLTHPDHVVRIGKPFITENGGGGYVNFADGYAFVGGVGGVKKIDMNNPDFPVVGVFTAGQADEGFPTPLGNLVFAGNDHHNYPGYGSGLIVHQAGRDTLGPEVNMVIPVDGSTRQATTSRIGLTFTDQIEGQSVTLKNIVVREVGGDTLPGLLSHQTAIINFHPLSLLKPNTQYEVLVRAGGVRDYVGNPSTRNFRSTFTTGDRSDCHINGPTDSWVGDSVTFSVSCQVPITTGVSWELGDGRELPYELGQTIVRHAYNKRGSYNVFARINGELIGGLSIRHTTLYPPVPMRARNSSTILLDARFKHIWNVNADNNSISVSNATTLGRIREIPVGTNPRTLALDFNERIWVTNQDDATITLIDAENGEPIRIIQLPKSSRPFGIVFAPGDTTAYVTLEATGTLLQISAKTLTVTNSLPLFPSARGVSISGDGLRIYVSRYVSGNEKGMVAEVQVEPFGLLRTIDLAYDDDMDTPTGGGGVPNAVAAVTFTPDGRNAWVPFLKDNVHRGLLSTEAGRAVPLSFQNTVRTAIGQIQVETGLEDPAQRMDFDNRNLANAITFSRTGKFAYITTGASNHTNILNGANGQNISAVVSSGSPNELAPDGLVLSSNDSLLFIHYYLSRQVGVYDVSTVGKSNQINRTALIRTVESEHLTPNVLRGKQVFYNADDPRMAKDSYMSCVVCHFDGGGTDRRVWDFTHKGEGLRRTISLLGRGGLSQGPLHWSANFDEVQDFEQDIRNEFGGTGFMSDHDFQDGGRNTALGGSKAGFSPDLDALSEYVTSLITPRPSPYRESAGKLTGDALAGEALFNRPDVGCAACHVPPRYTNSGSGGPSLLGYTTIPTLPPLIYNNSTLTQEGFLLQDVGTLKASSGKRLGKTLPGLDTPSLLGLWEGGPYLHDGSANTLMDVITTQNMENHHGRTQHLSLQEKTQLVAFLNQVDQSDAPFPVISGKPYTVSRSPFLSVSQTNSLVEFNWPKPLFNVVLEIHDARGTLVARLLPATHSPSNRTQFRWDTSLGQSARSVQGLFFASLKTPGFRYAQRFVLTP